MKKSKEFFFNNIKKRAYISPFGLSPKGISFVISSQISAHSICDYGCRNGDFLFEILKLKSHQKLIGIDLDGDALKKAKENDSENLINWILIKKGEKISLESNSADVLTMTEVLEHIYDKEFILNEIHRILSPDGVAIITVPGQHLFSFLDMANFKFIFPSIHKFFYVLFKDLEKYNYRYVNNPFGLIGDIEKEAGWHQQFSFDSFNKLVSSTNFKIIKAGGMGFFFHILNKIYFFLPNPFKLIIKKIIEIDSLLFSGAQRYFVLVKK